MRGVSALRLSIARMVVARPSRREAASNSWGRMTNPGTVVPVYLCTAVSAPAQDGNSFSEELRYRRGTLSRATGRLSGAMTEGWASVSAASRANQMGDSSRGSPIAGRSAFTV